MIREAVNWFLNTNSFVLVPSINNSLSGDLGLRSYIKYDKEILNQSLNMLAYSLETYYIYTEKNVNFFIYLLGGNTNNPIYFSNYDSNNIEIINFDLSSWNINDNISIYDSQTLEKILDTKIISKTDNSLQILNSISSNKSRYKIVNTTGTIYGNTVNIKYNNVLNHKLKFGSKLYANS